MYYTMTSMDSHETWAPAVRGGGNSIGTCPAHVKNHKNKKKCEGFSAAFFSYGVFAMWRLFCYFFSPYGRLFLQCVSVFATFFFI